MQKRGSVYELISGTRISGLLLIKFIARVDAIAGSAKGISHDTKKTIGSKEFTKSGMNTPQWAYVLEEISGVNQCMRNTKII